MSVTDINNKDLNQKRINETDVSVYSYDRAVVEDFRARFKKQPIKGNQVNDTIQIIDPQDTFRIYGEMNDDQVVMPFVSIQRLDWQLNLDRQGFQTFIGERVVITVDPNGNKKEIRAKIIPITINYNLSVWTTDRITNDALMQEILWYYHLRPTLLVNVGQGLNLKHNFNLYFNSGIEDNSDIANHKNKGRYFRQDISFYTDDAYLWKSDFRDIVGIDTDLVFSYGQKYYEGSDE